MSREIPSPNALNWLGRTDQVSPALLRLQLRGAALAPDKPVYEVGAVVALATVAVTGCGRGAGVPRWGMFQAAFASTASRFSLFE